MCDVKGKLNEWIRLFKSALKGHQPLFIIDDCSAEGEINKKQDALSELAFGGRHRNHSLWVLMQKYNSVSVSDHVGTLAQVGNSPSLGWPNKELRGSQPI